MKLTFTIPSLLFGCVAALPTRNEPTPVPDISGTTVGYSGNGCPQGSVSVAVQPKSAGQSGSYQLVATMNNMTVSGTPEAPRTSVSKNCVIQLYITIPEGWQLSMGADTEVNGYAWLVDESMKLRTLISYEYSYIDSPFVYASMEDIAGPLRGKFTAHGNSESDYRLWTTCSAKGTTLTWRFRAAAATSRSTWPECADCDPSSNEELKWTIATGLDIKKCS